MKHLPGSSAQIPRRALLLWLTAPCLAGSGAQAAQAPSASPWFVAHPQAPRDPARGPARAANDGCEKRLMQWPRTVLRLVVKYEQNPLRAARALAYSQVALHDAWVHALAWGEGAAEVAAHRAASRVLEHLYPHETPGEFEARFAILAMQARRPSGQAPRVPDAAPVLAEAVGQQVAAALVARSLHDGAGRVWAPRHRPADFVGAWQPTFPLYAANPAEGMAPAWRPWLEATSQRYEPPPPPRPGSALHIEQTREVLAASRALTEAQRDAAWAWHLDAGSVTPGGVWMQRTLQTLEQASAGSGTGDAPGIGAGRALGVTAAVAVAVHDAFIACWRIKMRDWSERPITAVRRDLDETYAPLLVTPGFPSYVSGHAAVSGAASQVLGAFFPAQQAAFVAMAEEAAQSRLWGGLHFRCDNEEGLLLGRSIGREVAARAGA